MLVTYSWHEGKVPKQVSFLNVCFRFLYFTGGNGYINDYPVGRFLRDAKLYEIGGGTSEVRKLVIGRYLNAEYS